MNKNFKFRNFISELLVGLIAVLFSFLFWNLWNGEYRNLVANPFYEKGAVLFMLEYIFIYEIFLRIYGGHEIGKYKVFDIIYSQILSILISNFILYIQICLLTKMMVNPFALIIMTIVQFSIIIVWSYVSKKTLGIFFSPLNLVIIYENNSVDSFINKFKFHKDKYCLCSKVHISEGMNVIMKEIEKYDAVIIYDVDSSMRNIILKYCLGKSIRIYITPKISDIIIYSAEKLHIFDTPILVVKNDGITLYQCIIKRLIDIVLSMVALIISSPIMIISAIAIKFYDNGPIIYKQKRLTKDDKIFEIYKFRSMITNAEESGQAVLAKEKDNRITPIGKVIRKIRVDELPQLFNILKGDMSIVGPRPERPEIASKYIVNMPEFNLRTKMKAGLTGYAQVMGKYNTVAYDKLKLDLMYIENYSLLLDLKIIVMTIKILFMSESTEGYIDDEEKESISI